MTKGTLTRENIIPSAKKRPAWNKEERKLMNNKKDSKFKYVNFSS